METSNTALECDVDQNDNLLAEDANIIEEYFNYEDFENEQHSSYDVNAVTYFAGFVARRSLEKNNCDKCRNIMMKTLMNKSTANEKYIQFREYPNIDEDAPIVTKLVRPTSYFTNIMRIQLLAFNKIWQHYWASTHILHIVMRCMEETNKIHATWFDINDECYNHRVQALRYMITEKIYSRTRYNNRAERKTGAPRRKVKNFLNE